MKPVKWWSVESSHCKIESNYVNIIASIITWSFICIVPIWLCCLTVTFKREFLIHKKSFELSIDGGKVMKAIAETLVLVWMGRFVGECAVYDHRTA